MKKRFFSVLLSSVMLAGMMVGCSSGDKPAENAPPKEDSAATNDEAAPEEAKTDDAPAADAEKKPLKIGYTTMDGTNPFFVTIETRIREIVEANGDQLLAVDPANDVSLQITQVEDLIAQGIDVMLMNPAEAEGILPALDQLKEANIPVIGFDTEVADMSYLASYVGSDNFNAGLVVGEDLVKKAPNGGKIIILDSPTMNSVTDRTNGFLKAIENKGFDIVAQQDAKGNLEVSMGITEDLLQANGDVIAIFGGNDPTALGALAAANAAGLKDCMIYGVDGSPDIKKELASGDSLIEGSGAQSPVTIAEITTEVMYKAVAGEAVDERYPVKTFLITKDNVAEYGTDGWQ